MSLLEYSSQTLVFFAVAAALGGLVKGAAGFGLPMVSVSLVASVTGPAQAIALLAVANIGTNIWQATSGGHYRAMLVRFWTLLVPLFFVTFLATQMLVVIDQAVASLLLGCVVIAFSLLQLSHVHLTVRHEWTRWMSPIVGLTSGLLGGISSFFGPPVTMYLVALRLPKDHFVSAIALCFLVGGAALYSNLVFNGILNLAPAQASVLAAVPAFVGLWAGRRLLRLISQHRFERLVLFVLLLIGLNLLRRGLG